MIPPEIKAENIAKALNARRNGNGWIARCPCPGHEDKHPSFSINVRDGKVFVRCLAGCPQGLVIDTLVHRGLWQRGPNGNGGNNSDHRAGADKPSNNDKPKDPMKTWRDATPFRRKSPVDRYLQSRGIEITDEEAMSIRWSPSLWHWCSQAKWPAMLARVALVNGTDLGTHQTYVEFDGSGKAPLGDKARLFAAGGRTRGGGVWFGAARADQEFIIGEGIESTLSAMRIRGATSGCAALSADGIRTLILPPEAKLVRIFADHDEMNQSLLAARDAKKRWTAEGRTVTATIAENVGEDANDVWLRRCRVKAG